MLISRRFSLSRVKMLGLLDEMEAATDTAKSLYVPFGLPVSEVENLLIKAFGPQDIPQGLVELAANSKTGATLFWGSPRKYLILPPFPLAEGHLADGYDVAPLRCLLKHDFRVALALVRLGAYAVGICQGENIISSKVGTGLVHARHKKGGSSQQRFQRHREKQIEYFLTRVCTHVREQLEPYSHVLDYIVYGGAWTTILSLRKRCSFLRQFDDRTLPPLLNIPEPRKVVLEAAISQVWSSIVTEWHDNEDPDTG